VKDRPDNQVRAQLLAELATRNFRIALASVPGSMVLALWIRNDITMWRLLIPLLITVVGAGMSFLTASRYRREPAPGLGRMFVLTNTITGFGWGLFALLCIPVANTERTVSAILWVLMGVVSGSSASNGSDKRTFVGFVAPLFSLTLVGVILGNQEVFLPIAITVYLGVIVEGFRLTYNAQRTAFEQNNRADDLAAKLAEALAETEHESLHDPLTGAGNRRLLAKRTTEVVDEQLALLAVDLDLFKQINDTYGHGAGDELLIIATERIRELVRSDDDVIRLGGDEFIALVRVSPAVATSIANRLLTWLSDPYDLSVGRVHVGVSVGIANAVGGELFEDLRKRADQALYEAKSRGRGCVVSYESLPTALTV
jgi:diguanylate cyclase (GGDEF)-like protein